MAGFLVFCAASLPFNVSAANAQGHSALSVRIEPGAVMTVEPAVSADQPGPSENSALVRIDLAVRLNPGATAVLLQYPAPESTGTAGDQPKQIFAASHNGRYSLTVGVGSLSGSASGKGVRFELKSSDQAFDISKTF